MTVQSLTQDFCYQQKLSTLVINLYEFFERSKKFSGVIDGHDRFGTMNASLKINFATHCGLQARDVSLMESYAYAKFVARVVDQLPLPLSLLPLPLRLRFFKILHVLGIPQTISWNSHQLRLGNNPRLKPDWFYSTIIWVNRFGTSLF